MLYIGRILHGSMKKIYVASTDLNFKNWVYMIRLKYKLFHKLNNYFSCDLALILSKKFGMVHYITSLFRQ